MKNIILLTVICILSVTAFAQPGSDSLAYQLERKKINEMLAKRVIKFGRYDESLSMHTGIFGLQTKKDIRRSNDILMDIVKTDDDIYKQLKILLEYHAFQETQAQNHSKETENNNIGFMATINKLRNQVDQLKTDAAKQEESYRSTLSWHYILFILMFASILYRLTRKRPGKA